MYCVVESAGNAAIAEAMLLYLAQDELEPTTYAVDGIVVGRLHIEEAEVEGDVSVDVSEFMLELLALMVVVIADSVLVVELPVGVTVDILSKELVDAIDWLVIMLDSELETKLEEEVELEEEVKLNTIELAAEIAFKTLESTQVVFGVV
jgi:hypothetical protein